MHGALLAILAMQQHGVPPIMHLRSLNPYVASAFEEWRRMHQAALPMPPRQAAAWEAAPRALAGCSSFGMSGVNAHALLSTPHVQERPGMALFWQRRRYWPLPAPHPMLAVVAWEPIPLVARLAGLASSCHMPSITLQLIFKIPFLSSAGSAVP